MTLLERVAIAGCAALAVSVASPVAIRAIDARREATCLANVRQITAALRTYQLDQDGGLPAVQTRVAGPAGARYATWLEATSQQDLRCPARASRSHATYGLNQAAARAQGVGPCPLVADGVGRFDPMDTDRCDMWFLHPGGYGTVGWTDGHVTRECAGSPRLASRR